MTKSRLGVGWWFQGTHSLRRDVDDWRPSARSGASSSRCLPAEPRPRCVTEQARRLGSIPSGAVVLRASPVRMARHSALTLPIS